MLNLLEILFMTERSPLWRNDFPVNEKPFNTRHSMIYVSSTGSYSQIPTLILFGKGFKISTSDFLKRLASIYQEEQKNAHECPYMTASFVRISISQFFFGLLHLQFVGGNENFPMLTQGCTECLDERETGTAVATEQEKG